MAAEAAQRPVLKVHQGTYFRYEMPDGWRAQETTNGVDLVAPDGVTGASSALLVNAFGQATPESYLQFILGQLNYPQTRVVSQKRLADQPGPMGMPWQVMEARMSYVYQGVPVEAEWIVAVAQTWGQFSAVMVAWQAPVGRFEADRLWLPAVAQSVVVTNPRQVAGLDRVQLPRNNPMDDTLMESWREKQLSEDRISKARSEGILGYERVEDPTTGQRYTMPLESWDPTVGGYRNPVRPDELLEALPPGE